MRPIAENAENRLEKVFFEIRSGNLPKALVRLWVICRSRLLPVDGNGGDLMLNHWERNKNPDRYENYLDQIRRSFTDGKNILNKMVREEPLALIRALDGFLAEERAPRPTSHVPYEVDGQEYWLVRIPAGRRQQTSINRQANNPSHWFCYHNVIPTKLGAKDSAIEIRVVEPDLATKRRLEELCLKAKLRTYLVHFNDKVELRYQSNPAGKAFVFGLNDAEKRMHSIEHHLSIAIKERADVVIFPELTVTAEQRQAIRSRCIKSADNREPVPILIVAGSFHEIRGGRKVNRAEMLSVADFLLSHEKIRPYGFAEGLAEDIDSGNCIRLLTTAIGLIAMPICKDFNDAEALDWHAIGPDFCLVPSMGDGKNINAHSEQARRLWKIFFQTISVIGNQEFEGDPIPGFGFAGTEMIVPAGGGVIEIPI